MPCMHLPADASRRMGSQESSPRAPLASRTCQTPSQLASQASASAKSCCRTMSATLRPGAGGRRRDAAAGRFPATAAISAGRQAGRVARHRRSRSLLRIPPGQLHELAVFAPQHGPAVGLHAAARHAIVTAGAGMRRRLPQAPPRSMPRSSTAGAPKRGPSGRHWH